MGIQNIERMKVEKGRRADKEDRRSQKRKIIGKRRETKKKQKRRTKKRKKLCSTSPTGGNQVDGLPPLPHSQQTGSAQIGKFYTFFRLCGCSSVNDSKFFTGKPSHDILKFCLSLVSLEMVIQSEVKS